MSTPTIAVLLAAGAGTRFDGDGHKLDAELDGIPVADHAVRAALDAGVGPVVVVTGAIVPELPTCADEVDDGTVTFVDNPDWAEGMSTSLAVAVREAADRHAHAIVVGLADQPFVTPETWRAVAASTWPIAAAEYDGRLRNPVRLHHSVWPLLPDAGDHGARHLLRLRPELVERVPSQGSPADIDTLEDLRSWQNRSSTNSR
ncbi:MAG: nucleotidyltransferase family protein [Ilumatobacteraceae bacterium]